MAEARALRRCLNQLCFVLAPSGLHPLIERRDLILIES